MPNSHVQPIWVRREYILDRRTWVYYLIIVEAAARHWQRELKVAPNEQFFEVLNTHVKAFVEKGKKPPKTIASAVLNMADDWAAGRDIVLRAGDYIAVQDFMRRRR